MCDTMCGAQLFIYYSCLSDYSTTSVQLKISNRVHRPDSVLAPRLGAGL